MATYTRLHARPVARAMAALTLVGFGSLHAAAVPEHAEQAGYIGVLFALNAAAAVALAAMLLSHPRPAWPLAAALAAVTVVLYVVARSAGLPAYHENDWVDAPYGLPSLALEVLLVVLYVGAGIAGRERLSGRKLAAPRRLPHRASAAGSR